MMDGMDSNSWSDTESDTNNNDCTDNNNNIDTNPYSRSSSNNNNTLATDQSLEEWVSAMEQIVVGTTATSNGPSDKCIQTSISAEQLQEMVCKQPVTKELFSVLQEIHNWDQQEKDCTSKSHTKSASLQNRYCPSRLGCMVVVVITIVLLLLIGLVLGLTLGYYQIQKSSSPQGILPSVLIFLDIDGVLLPLGASTFPNTTLQAFATIYNSFPDKAIILSSSWRLDRSLQQRIVDQFQQYPPLASFDNFYDITDPTLTSDRQLELYQWLYDHNLLVVVVETTTNKENIGTNTTTTTTMNHTAWITLDDLELLDGPINELHQSIFVGHVIDTDKKIGLTMDLAQDAINLIREQQLRYNV